MEPRPKLDVRNVFEQNMTCVSYVEQEYKSTQPAPAEVTRHAQENSEEEFNLKEKCIFAALVVDRFSLAASMIFTLISCAAFVISNLL